MQVHHEPFLISANGFFHIDLKLLRSVSRILNVLVHLLDDFFFQIVLTSITYVVILIQFDVSNKDIEAMSHEI